MKVGFKIKTLEEAEEFLELVPQDIKEFYSKQFPSTTTFFHFPSNKNNSFQVCNHTSSCLWDGYEEVTFEEWKKMISPLPTKWAIKVNKENLAELGGFFNNATYSCLYTNESNIGRYYHSHNINGVSIFDYKTGTKLSYIEERKMEGFQEIDLETFRKITMQKIIGYKAPKDLFGGAVKQGSLFELIKGISGVKEGMWYANGESAKSTNYSKHLPKEIVEEWEPVYKEEQRILDLGTPKRKFTVEKENISVICGGNNYTFNRKDLDWLFRYFQGETHFSSNSIRVYPITVQIGCEDGTSLTKEDIMLLETAQRKIQ